jgi:hypothetical protein
MSQKSSWKERLLIPPLFTLSGIGIALVIWFAFFEYDPDLTAHGFFPKVWQYIVANVEIVAVVACVGGAIGLCAGIVVAAFGRN